MPARLFQHQENRATAAVMRFLMQTIKDLGEDCEGATVIEYSLLVGVIITLAISLVGAIGYWASGRWEATNIHVTQ